MLHKNGSKRAGFSRVYLAFAGFYNSYLDDELESALSRDIDYAAERTGGDDAGEKLVNSVNWPAACEYVAKDYCAAFGGWLSQSLQLLYGESAPAAAEFTFVELHRPREYNFEADKIEAEVKTEDLQRIFSFVMEKDGAGFRKYFAERLEPRSGFIPFYPNDVYANGAIEEWPACLVQILFNFIDDRVRDLEEYVTADNWYIEAAQAGGVFEDALCESDEYTAILNSIE